MKDLSEIDIARICISSPFLNKFFGGVYPRSFYPDSQKIGSNKFYIYNNQMEDSAGMHWIMIFYMKDKTIYVPIIHAIGTYKVLYKALWVPYRAQ